jgi:hypothetical protein
MNRAVGALVGCISRLFVKFESPLRRVAVAAVFIVSAISGIRDIFLGYGRKIDHCVGDGVSSAEGNYNATRPWGMRECNISAGIGKKRPCIESLQGG